MEMIENHAYHRLTLLFQGQETVDNLIGGTGDGALDRATLGYGVGMWHLLSGRRQPAVEVFQRVMRGLYWPAFGYIACEQELINLGARGDE